MHLTLVQGAWKMHICILMTEVVCQCSVCVCVTAAPSQVTNMGHPTATNKRHTSLKMDDVVFSFRKYETELIQ